MNWRVAAEHRDIEKEATMGKPYHTKRHAALLPVPADAAKKWMTCLGCNVPMFTDRCNRFCMKCQRRNEASPVSVCRQHGYRTDLRPDGSNRKYSLRSDVIHDGEAIEVLAGMGRKA